MSGSRVLLLHNNIICTFQHFLIPSFNSLASFSWLLLKLTGCQHSQAVYNQEAVSWSEMIERLLIKDKNQCSSARKTCSIKSFASQQCSGKYSLEIAYDVTEASLTASKSCLYHLFCFAQSSLIPSLLSCNSARRLFVQLIQLWLECTAQRCTLLAAKGSSSCCLPIRYFTRCTWQSWATRGDGYIISDEMVLSHSMYCWHL